MAVIGAVYKVEATVEGRDVVYIGSATDIKRRLATNKQKIDAIFSQLNAKISMKNVRAELNIAASRRKTRRSAISEALRAAESAALRQTRQEES